MSLLCSLIGPTMVDSTVLIKQERMFVDSHKLRQRGVKIATSCLQLQRPSMETTDSYPCIYVTAGFLPRVSTRQALSPLRSWAVTPRP